MMTWWDLTDLLLLLDHCGDFSSVMLKALHRFGACYYRGRP
jgi:hypothetical protein